MEQQQSENTSAHQHDPTQGDGGAAPVMSVILPTANPDMIRGVIKRLKSQTIAHVLEIVVVTPLPASFEDMQTSNCGFHSVTVVELPDLSSLGTARAVGLKAACAPCAFLGETHSFASVPDWAERLVARHGDGWAVVVPGFRNANSSNFLSWSGFLLDYGSWIEDLPGGEIDYWPLNNACCDRAAVLDIGEDPAHALSYGDQLLLALKAAGHRVYFEPAATLSHLNIGRWKQYLDEHWIGGHLVARYRSRDWSLMRRWVYVMASPAIAILMFARVLRPATRAIRDHDLSMAILPTMLLGSIARALGELLGYTHWGSDKASERRMTEYELNKVNYT